MSQDLVQILIFLGIGLIAGWLAGLVLGGGGLLRNLVAGIIGVFVGGYVLKLANINLPIDNPYLSQIITGTIGALIVIVVARVIAK
jgi:uncharacterized membrane protein YeaQ/YmgE (transglycosylase-associated protein family)